jgi:uncharacterized protein YdbL (DUF1318 family)
MTGEYRTDIQTDGQMKNQTTDINTERQSKGWLNKIRRDFFKKIALKNEIFLSKM